MTSDVVEYFGARDLYDITATDILTDVEFVKFADDLFTTNSLLT